MSAAQLERDADRILQAMRHMDSQTQTRGTRAGLLIAHVAGVPVKRAILALFELFELGMVSQDAFGYVLTDRGAQG